MKIIFINGEFIPVYSIGEEEGTLFLSISEGPTHLKWVEAVKFAAQFGYPEDSNVHPTGYGCYIDECSFTEEVIARQYDHIHWENYNKASYDAGKYVETRKVIVLSI